MKRSCPELSIDMVVHKDIFQNEKKYALPLLYLQRYETS